jgi:hypothetical protein
LDNWKYEVVILILVIQVLQGAIPPGTSEEVRSFVKEVIESSMKEWNDSDGKVDAGVRFCVGKDTSKEFLPLVGVDKVVYP